jgi:hypothetical protein
LESPGFIELVGFAPLDTAADANGAETVASRRFLGRCDQTRTDATPPVAPIDDKTADLHEPRRLDSRRSKNVDPPDDGSIRGLGHEDVVTVVSLHAAESPGQFAGGDLIAHFGTEPREGGCVGGLRWSDVHLDRRHGVIVIGLCHASDTIDGKMTSANPPGFRFSLVIPAFNEARLLPGLLDSIAVARSRYRFGADAVQVVVADNTSTDTTAAVAEESGCEVVTVPERRIGMVRNGGARAAVGEILGFVDADTRIHPETFNAIEDVLATGRVVAGATGVRLDRWSPGIAATYALYMPFVWVTRMDTGVVFCRRTDFEAVGGYDERRAFGEDVQLLVDLRRLGRKRGQRLTRLTSVKAVASTRKFDTHGDWHYFTEIVRLLPLILWSPKSTSAFAESYWYGDQRPP